MTLAEIKDKVLNKYHIGQVLKIKIKDGKGTVTGKANIEIIKFYPYHVLCKIDDCLESYTYWDFLNLKMQTKNKKLKKKSGHKGITWNKANEKWIVTLWANGKNKYIGSHKDLGEAVRIKQDYLKGEV